MGPKILVFDVETSPLITYTWGLFDQNIGLEQIKNDWHLLSWAAKWLNEKEILYQDQRHARRISDDKKLLKGLWELLDEADIVVTQNGNSFDIKKLNARFIINGMKPPASYQCIDTFRIAKRKFGFTSNKLQYLTDVLCKKYKKLKHTKYPGFELWEQVLAGNLDAWEEMERYNKHDVLSLEELYLRVQPWAGGINFSLYRNENIARCNCGSKKFKKIGFNYTPAGKFQRYRCSRCGAELRERRNMLKLADKPPVRV